MSNQINGVDATVITKELIIIPFGSDEAVATGNGTLGIAIPEQYNGFEITDVRVSVKDKGVTGTTIVQIRRERAGASADVLSTRVTLGDEYTVADGEINTSNDDLQTGDMLFVDVDEIHSGTAPNGLSVNITISK